MIQRGEQAATGSTAGRLGGIARLKFVLLRDEVLAGSPLLARLGLITAALALQTVILFSPGHFRPAGDSIYAVLVPLGLAGSLAACFLATLQPKRIFGLRARQGLAILALAGPVSLAGVGIWRGEMGVQALAQGTPYTNDGAVMDLYAAEQVAKAHNPYLSTNIVKALADLNAPATTTTPKMDGQFRGARAYPTEEAVQQVFMNVLRYRPRTIPPEFESNYNYPSGSFLFILPFVWAGLHDMRFLYLLAILVMGAYLCYRMPRALRFLVPFVLLANVPLIVLTAGGQPDPIYGLFLMLGFAEWTAPRVSPLCMGLAIGTKQISWFFIPFYLVLVAREYGWHEAVRRAGLMSAVFLMLNGPFIVKAPGAYFASIAAPMTDPLFPLGIGIVSLFVSNLLPMLPKLAFTAAEGAAWLASTLAFGWLRHLPPASGAVLAMVPLFFAWRSLTNYFYLLPLIALAVILADRREHDTASRPVSA